MTSAYDVANFFIEIVNGTEDDQVTNLKLNKLLYFAQGVYMSRTGNKLFEEDIEAWPLGPVVPCVYHKYKNFGKNPIVYVDVDYNAEKFTSEELDAMLDVMREYGIYTGSKLVSLTHSNGSPWQKTTEANKTIISKDEIKKYFVEHPVKRFDEIVDIPIVTAFPKDWYDPEDDAVWEEYM